VAIRINCIVPLLYAYCDILALGMIGFDGGGHNHTASREAPNSKNQRNIKSANRTDYAALPLAA
jgi:hypothetical protein